MISPFVTPKEEKEFQSAKCTFTQRPSPPLPRFHGNNIVNSNFVQWCRSFVVQKWSLRRKVSQHEASVIQVGPEENGRTSHTVAVL